MKKFLFRLLMVTGLSAIISKRWPKQTKSVHSYLKRFVKKIVK